MLYPTREFAIKYILIQTNDVVFFHGVINCVFHGKPFIVRGWKWICVTHFRLPQECQWLGKPAIAQCDGPQGYPQYVCCEVRSSSHWLPLRPHRLPLRSHVGRPFCNRGMKYSWLLRKTPSKYVNKCLFICPCLNYYPNLVQLCKL